MNSHEFRKITVPADSRMRSRTAKEQLEAVMRELNRKQDYLIPDEEDESIKRDIVLS